jgi:hypothetical protein
MRKLVLAVAVAVAAASPALAGPKDGTKDSLIGINGLAGNATIDNTLTAVTMKSKGCKLQLQMKDVLGLANGAVLICVAGADVISPPALPLPAGNSVVFLAEYDAAKGAVKMKADLTEIGCGSADNIQWGGDLRCYLDSPGYRGPSSPGVSWDSLCAGVPMGALPNTATSPDKLVLNPALNVIVGLCQGFVAGQRIPPPASAEICRRGSRGFAAP